MKYIKIRLLIVVMVFGYTIFQSCEQNTKSNTSSTQELSAIDGRGKEIKLPKEAERVITLYESIVDYVFMLDAQDKLVGVPQQIYLNEDSFKFLSQFDSRFANKEIATPTFGGGSSNVEAIIGLKPDLVITFNNDNEAIEQLESLGIPVYAISTKNKDAILNELKGMATLMGKSNRADTIIQYVNAEVEKMVLDSISTPKKVYYAWSKGRVLSTSGKGTLMDMAINLSGTQNACPLELDAPNVGAETLYKWNPDLIILWNSKESDVYNLSEIANLPAVMNKQVRVMKPSIYFDPHTVKFLLFAKQVRHWSYPDYSEEAFNEDVNKALDVFYHKRN